MTHERKNQFANLTDHEFYTRLFCNIVAYQQPYLPSLDAEDCSIALLIKLWARHKLELEDYRQGRRPESWLRVSAQNAAKNFMVERRRHQGLDEPYSVPIEEADESSSVASMSGEISLEATAIAEELSCRLKKTLSRLPHTTQSILLRRFVDAETWVEIATALGDTPDNVRQKAVRSLHRLKKMLDADGFSLVEAEDYLASILLR